MNECPAPFPFNWIFPFSLFEHHVRPPSRGDARGPVRGRGQRAISAKNQPAHAQTDTPRGAAAMGGGVVETFTREWADGPSSM